MILCVNPNAAVDKTVVVENFTLNAIHRPSFELALPGGKGCNVARAAKTLGQQPVVTGWVGGTTGQFIEQGLQAEGITTAFIHTQVESRTCLSIADPLHHTMTEIYEKGRPVSAEELAAFYDIFRTWLPRVQMVTLSGSLPPGVPPNFYAELIGLARAAAVPVILDSSGEPLRLGLLEGRPEVVKCNRLELAGAVGTAIPDLDAMRYVVRELAARLGSTLVITLGEIGALAAVPNGEIWLVQAPTVEAVSAVGSGDAFLAGLACGMVAQQTLDVALRLAVAAGSANTLRMGAGQLRREDVEDLRELVRMAKEV